MYASRGQKLLALALEKKESKSWGKYPSQDKKREETVNKHFVHTSVKQMLGRTVNESLDSFPAVPLSTLSDDAVVPHDDDYNDDSDYYNLFEEIAVEIAVDRVDYDTLNDVRELFLPKIDVDADVEAIVSSEIKDVFSRNDTVKDVDIDFTRSTSNGVSINNYPEEVSEGVPENSVEQVVRSKSSAKRKSSLVDSHPILPACNNKCKRKCSENFSDATREKIHEEYWGNSRPQQREFIFQRVISEPKKRTRIRKSPKKNRKFSRKYTLKKKETGEQIQVCGYFFLSTLGYKKDHVVSKIFSDAANSSLSSAADKRGSHVPPHKLPDEVVSEVTSHINSFHPSVSHYRRSHAPLRRYLPPGLSVSQMHFLFNENRQNPVSYDSYRRTFNKMNISFTKLGEEECESCEQFRHHECIDSETVVEKSCLQCQENERHLQRARLSRKAYCVDVENNGDHEHPHLSMDMQKVLMLPHMPGCKTALFTPRIFLINQTLAPLGGKGKSMEKPICFLWHEAIQGRQDEDVASVVIKFLKESVYRDSKDITIWCDNCSGQNKNWTLFTSLVHFICSDTPLQTLNLNFFEKGHTFMSADSVHHQVEKSIRGAKNLYDFKDFVRCVESSSTAVPMEPKDFIDFRSEKSVAKDTCYPLLAEISQIQFRKKSTKMYWKTSHDVAEEFKSGEFLQKRFRKACLNGKPASLPKGVARGVSVEKKKKIIKNLASLMPNNRLLFWKELPENEQAEYLSDEELNGST